MTILDTDGPELESTGPSAVRRGGLVLGHYTHPLISLSCRFDALPRGTWRDVIGAARALGFRMLDVVVVWAHHEATEGEFEFGHADPQLDLRGFLRLAHSSGLFVCIRPGPRQPQLWRLEREGLPRHALAVSPPAGRPARSSALEPDATPAAPSLADPAYLEPVERWLRRLGEEIRPLCYPRGPVVAAHLECTATLQPYDDGDGDTHPEAVALFRAFAKSRYERPSLLRLAYDDAALDFTAIAPPGARQGDVSPLSPRLDWVRCQAQLASAALDRFARALTESCPALPTSVPEFESRARLKLRWLDTSVQGDSEPRRWATPPGSWLLDAPAGRLPLLDVVLGAATDETHRILAALACGCRGVVITPGCEAPGVVNSLLTATGDATGAMQRLAPVLQALERTQFHLLRLEPCVHIVVPDQLRELDRLQRAHLAEASWFRREGALEAPRPAPVPTEFEELHAARRVLGWLEAALGRRGVPYRYCIEWELDTVTGSAPWTVLPTVRELGPELAETIGFARRRGLPLSVGPVLPAGVDGSDRSSDWPLLLADTEQGLGAQIDALLAQGYLPAREVSAAEARVLFHVRPESDANELAIAFVLNPTAADIEVAIACPGYDARDAITQAAIASFAERLAFTVPAESVRMLELSTRGGS